MVNPSLQDFTTVDQEVKRLAKEFDLPQESDGFYYLVLSLLFDMQPDEVEEAITDNYFLQQDNKGGHDRGIDAVVIEYHEEDSRPPTVHLFNFKYKGSPKKLNGHIESGEIDKIVNFLEDLISENEALTSEHINPVLSGYVREIWGIYHKLKQNPNYVIHLCSNMYQGFEPSEDKRFSYTLTNHSFMTYQYLLMPDLIKLLRGRDKQIVNARIRAIDKNYFAKSDSDVRALVANVHAIDIVRIVIDSAEIRDDVELEEPQALAEFNILEDAFEDNVRVYLSENTAVNQSIKQTLESDDSYRFFYFHNGITITCEEIKYPEKKPAPIISLTNLQVVNGGQTIHALYEAFRKNPELLTDVEILCRIYETSDKDLSTRIAEYTNNQNPVQRRDIRAISPIQQNLELQFQSLGYSYERKKNQYPNATKDVRIDAEKAAQVMLAYYNRQPHKPKTQKKHLFGSLFSEIFTDEITAEAILLAYKLFQEIEKRKREAKKKLRTTMVSGEALYEQEMFIAFASYHILFILGVLAERDSTPSEVDKILSHYDEAVDIVRKEIIRHQTEPNHTHRVYFNSDRFAKAILS